MILKRLIILAADMSRETRVKRLREIEEATSSKVITYITSDRQPFGGRIHDDAVRPMYDHILDGTDDGRVSLFLYSRGGSAVVPWRIVSMLRENYKEVQVLIPYKAHSAATMIALGADRIFMGRKAELGPIDPTLTREPGGGDTSGPREISVEDVNSYVEFIRERAGISDQDALAQAMATLSQTIEPLTLGRVHRERAHIHNVAKKLLASHNNKVDESKMQAIIEALTEKMYSHGHAVGRKEATELGLPIEVAEDALGKSMWQLYLEYEKLMELWSPIDFEEVLRDDEGREIESKEMTGLRAAIIESTERLSEYTSTAIIKRQRRTPPNLNMNLNLNLSLPPNVNLAALNNQDQAQVQQLLQSLLADVQQKLPAAVENEIKRQAPTMGFDARVFGGRWQTIDGNGGGEMNESDS